MAFEVDEEWPEPDAAPRITRVDWDTAVRAVQAVAKSDRPVDAVATFLTPIVEVAAELSMRLTLEDAAELVTRGSVFARASWSKIKAYIVHAHLGDEWVAFTLGYSPPLMSSAGP